MDGVAQLHTMGIEGPFSEVKRSERETDNSPTPYAKLKNGGATP
jgi:hypothetical protein